eukprot:SAG22_NODE_724_length_7634_cov_11.669808_1_plen_84_part_00
MYDSIRRLNVIFVSLVSFFSTAIPLAIALMGPPSKSLNADQGGDGSSQCELTALQTSAIRGLAGLFNSSCDYNASITEVLTAG